MNGHPSASVDSNSEQTQAERRGELEQSFKVHDVESRRQSRVQFIEQEAQPQYKELYGIRYPAQMQH